MKRGNARVAVRHRHPQPKLRGIYAGGARRCANVYGLGHYRPRTMKDSVRKVASGRQRTVSERPGRKPAASKRRAALVIGQRERLVAEIAAIRKLGQASDLTAKAEGLLTRWWARANWEARERLISAAEWLLRLETNRGARPSA